MLGLISTLLALLYSVAGAFRKQRGSLPKPGACVVVTSSQRGLQLPGDYLQATFVLTVLRKSLQRKHCLLWEGIWFLAKKNLFFLAGLFIYFVRKEFTQPMACLTRGFQPNGARERTGWKTGWERRGELFNPFTFLLAWTLQSCLHGWAQAYSCF